MVPGKRNHKQPLAVLRYFRVYAGIQNGSVLIRHEPVAQSLYLLRDPIECASAVMSKQMRHILEQKNLWAVGAEFTNQSHNFEEDLPSFILEARFGTGHGKRLTRESGS